MKNILLLFIILSSFQFSCSQKEKEQNDKLQVSESKFELLANGDLRFLRLTGTPYERGLAHGKALKTDIEDVIKLFKEDIIATTQRDPDEFINDFLAQTEYIAAVEKYTPELMEEVKGISDGSGIPLETIFMHQLADEYWFNAKDITTHSCSTFGVDKTSDLPSFTAQNMDIPEFYHGFQTAIHAKEVNSDKEIMYLAIPGHLGLTGMNNQSVSINCNTLMQLNYSKTGLPVTFIVRGVLSKNTQEEALAFLKEIEHASGQNYIIGGPERVYDLECSASQVVEYRPFANSIFAYHTNHPMSNTDYSTNYKASLLQNNKTVEEGLYECQRIKSFQSRFTETSQAITIEKIKEVLSSRDTDDTDVVSNRLTYASVIYELSDTPRFIIAPGKPHEKEYLEILWK